jgi:hypothetical protein
VRARGRIALERPCIDAVCDGGLALLGIGTGLGSGLGLGLGLRLGLGLACHRRPRNKLRGSVRKP